MTVKLRIIIGAIAAFVVMLLLLLWAFFACRGITPIEPLIYQIASLITIVVGLVSAFFGHQSRAPGVDADAVSPPQFVDSRALVAPQPEATVSGVQPAPAAQSSEPVPTLQ